LDCRPFFALPERLFFGITLPDAGSKKERLMMWRKLLAVVLLGMAGSAWAGDHDVLVKNAWVGESAPGQTTASVQLDLTSARISGKLIAVDSTAAESAEMQRLWPSGGKIRMVKVRNVRLPRGRAVSFGEHSVSIMLLGLKQPLKIGDHIPVNLTVMLADGQKVTAEAKVEVRALDLSYKHYEDEKVQDH
jgi:periplasmic copper chaperone A